LELDESRGCAWWSISQGCFERQIKELDGILGIGAPNILAPHLLEFMANDLPVVDPCSQTICV
jgi:hypothetical protein